MQRGGKASRALVGSGCLGVLASAAVVALLVGCAGAGARSNVVRSVVRQRSSSPVRWEAVLLPPRLVFRGEVVAVGEDADGAVLVQALGLRARVRGSAVEWASEATLHPVVARARDGDRWLFATQDGVLFRSDSFTGPLVRVGETDRRELDVGFVSTGVLAAGTREGRLWLGGPGDVFRPAVAPADGPLIDAGFIDRSFGVVAVSPGRLFRTTDGGAHYEPVNTGSHAVLVVYPNPDGFVLTTTGGPMWVGPNGPAVAHTGSIADLHESLSSETERALRASLRSDYPLAYPTALATPGAAVLSNGQVALVDGQDAVILGPEGIVARMELPGQNCLLHAWGSRWLAQCQADDDTHTLHFTRGDRPWSELYRGRIDGAVVAGRDGSSIVLVGTSCDENERPHEHDQTPLCWYDGTRWQSRTLQGRVYLLDVWGETVLYREFDEAMDEEHAPPVYMVRMDEPGEGSPVPLDMPSATLVYASFTDDGQIAGTARKGNELYAAIGGTALPLAVSPLPQGAIQVAFANATHGIAVGEHLGEVWVTTDGAHNWRRLDIPLDGDPAGLLLRGRPRFFGDVYRVEVSCSAAACTVGSRLVWMASRGSSTAASMSLRLRAARRAPVRTEEAPAVTDSGMFHAGEWNCAPVRSGPTMSVLPTGRLYGTGGWVELQGAIGDVASGGLVGFFWGGTDERGRFRVRSRSGVIGSLTLPAGATVGQTVLFPRLVTRTLALIERCTTANYDSYCDAIVAPRGGAPRVSFTHRALLDLNGRRIVLMNAMGLPDGGAAVHLRPAEGDETLGLVGNNRLSRRERLEPRVDLLVRLDARGQIVAQRGFVWAPGPVVRMLARGPAGPGLVVASASEPRVLRFYGLDPDDAGQVISTLPASRLGVCRGSAGNNPRVTLVSVSAAGFGPTLYVGAAQMMPPYNARVMLEVGSEVCLRGVAFWSIDPNEPGERDFLAALGGAPGFWAVEGMLRGAAMDAAADRALECRGE